MGSLIGSYKDVVSFTKKSVEKPLTIRMMNFDNFCTYEFTNVTADDFDKVFSQCKSNDLVKVSLSKETIDELDKEAGCKITNEWMMLESDANKFFNIVYYSEPINVPENIANEYFTNEK